MSSDVGQPVLFPDRDPTDLGMPWLPPEPPPHACRNGWLDDDEDGHPVPCLRCKPHLHPEGPRGWKVSRTEHKEPR